MNIEDVMNPEYMAARRALRERVEGKFGVAMPAKGVKLTADQEMALARKLVAVQHCLELNAEPDDFGEDDKGFWWTVGGRKFASTGHDFQNAEPQL